ncbi:MAG: MdtA/MuxA family multidrug efflux RND transporter periplasmic adaptor subunit [Betaproteobacteria bacterium]
MNPETEVEPVNSAPPRGALLRMQQRGSVLPWILVILLAAAAGVGWWQWKLRSADTAATQRGPGTPGAGGGGRFGGSGRTQPVSVDKVRRQDVHVNVSAIGTITASDTATVRAQVSGVLLSLGFAEGEQVRQGQLLAQLDPRAFQAAVSQVEGAMARDKASLDNARVDLLRYQDLLGKDAIAKQQVDTQAALVRQLEGTVKSDDAALQSARLQLSYTRVTAPIAGRAGLKQADIGNMVQPGDSNGIVIITRTRPIALLFSVPSAHVSQIVARLRNKQPMQVEAWDRGGSVRLATGKVATVDNAIDPTTDTLKVKALFPNLDDALFPNQTVSVRLRLDTLSDALTVPSAALLKGAQGAYVWVVDDTGTVHARVITPGTVDGNRTAFEGPLQEGETVVIDGVDRLREGANVEVIASDPAARVGNRVRPPRTGASGPAGSGKAAHAGAGPAARSASGSAAASAGSAAAPTGSAAAEGGQGSGRPRWMDRVPPEMVEKLKAMSPEERRAWFQQNRASLLPPSGAGN